jgi:DNA ligase 1
MNKINRPIKNSLPLLSIPFFSIPVLSISLLSSLSFTSLAEIQVSTLTAPAPPLLLAKNINSNYRVEEFLISEKLDGIRAYWNGQNLLSRRGNIIATPSWFTKDLPKVPLDGELWIARGEFEALSSTIRNKNSTEQQWQSVKYMIFDLPSDLAPFYQRYQKLKLLVKNNISTNIAFVEQIKVSSNKALNDHLSTLVAKGAEGLMLHKADSLYQAKRSFDLQKLKPFDDAEATVVGYIEGKGKYQGLMGAIEVVNEEGIKFKIGSGFNLQERKTPPQLKSRITYRYRGKTKYNTPRFATFLRQKHATD